MKRRVVAHIIANIIICIIGIFNGYIFGEFNLSNVMINMLKSLIYYWVLIGGAYLVRKLLKIDN